MKRVRQAAFACAVGALVVVDAPWGAITDQLTLAAYMLLIILVAVPLGSLGIYLVARAARVAKQAWLYPSRRRALARWTTEQRIAELEAANGYGVVWEGTCPACHAPLVMQARYCSACGRPVPAGDEPEVIVCHVCHQANPAQGRFCWHCGEPLPQPEHEPASGGQRPPVRMVGAGHDSPAEQGWTPPRR